MGSLLMDIERKTLVEGLRQTLRLARTVEDDHLAQWCRLELDGYWASNPAMTREVVVPEYRTVRGQHHDVLGRLLLLDPEFAYVGETRLRNGVEELVRLSNDRKEVVIQDPQMCERIRKHLSVDVYSFTFSSVMLTGMLAAIKTELSVRAASLPTANKDRDPSTAPRWYEIVSAKPSWFGFGVDLIALCRRVARTRD